MITATEMTIAARLNDMSYGQFVHLLKCGAVTIPPSEEIQARIVGKKKDDRFVKPVVQYDMKGEYIATYASTGEAAIAIGRDRRAACNITCNCCGKSNSAYGYQWRYEGDKAPGVYINRGEMPIRRTERVDKICVLCGKPYKGVQRSRYCSRDCAEQAQAECRKDYKARKKAERAIVYERVCKQCGKEFTTNRIRVAYCSAKCQQAYNSHAQYMRKKALYG